jgi:hypothetical protein
MKTTKSQKQSRLQRKKKQRESEQLNVDPEEIIDEEERRQPHSVDDE